MSIVAMKLLSVIPHPGADALRIHEFALTEGEPIVVVGNLDNAYEVGDVVAVARVGATLEDGTRIRKARLRGIDSFGMALEKVDAPVGTDLTDVYGSPQVSGEGTPVARWTSIELLHSLRRSLAALHETDGTALPSIEYRAKVKLDGTNAAVHALPNGFAAQSRTRVLTAADDNYGFARWLQDDAIAWARALHENLGRAVVFGEWAGHGIQKRTAIGQIEQRVFAVFAIQLGDPITDTARIVVDPDRIRTLLPEHRDVHVLPWHGPTLQLDFGDPDALQERADAISAMVDDVEARDPWVWETFGKGGMGEGLVLYPMAGGGIEFDARGSADRDRFAGLMFKAKGEKHRVTKQKKAAQIDPEVAASIDEFVEMMVTPARLEQGLREAVGDDLQMRRIGEFLAWLDADVRKESAAELEAAGLSWKQVNRAVTSAARTWFRARVQEA